MCSWVAVKCTWYRVENYYYRPYCQLHKYWFKCRCINLKEDKALLTVRGAQAGAKGRTGAKHVTKARQHQTAVLLTTQPNKCYRNYGIPYPGNS